MSNGSGTGYGYRVEIRADHAFVAGQLKHYQSMATPNGEFIIDQRWRTIPLGSLPGPQGTWPVGLESCPLAERDGLLCYESAKAIQHTALAHFRYSTGGVETRIVQVKYEYEYSTEESAEAPMRAFSDRRFVPEDSTAAQKE